MIRAFGVLVLALIAGILAPATWWMPLPIAEGEEVKVTTELITTLWGVRYVPDPPTVYRKWFKEVEECTGMTASFDDIFFYRARAARNHEHRSLYGLHRRVNHRSAIVTVGLSDGVEWLVKHEMIHYLLHIDRGIGDRRHITDWYRECTKSS